MSSFRDYYAIFNLLPVPLAVHDGLGNMTFFNQAFETTFGYTTADIPTLEAWWPAAYPDPAYRQKLATLWQQYTDEAKRTGEPFRPMEADVRCKDGSVRTVFCSAAPLEGQEGHHLAILHDITERKRIEEKLRDSEDLFRSFMNNAPAVAWMKDDQFRFVYLSRAWERQLGIPAADFLGKTDFEVWPQETAESFRRNDEIVINSNQALEDIEESILPNGQHRFWAISKFPFEDSSGRRFIGGMGIDITEQKHNEVLLENAKEEAEAANRAKTQFLANMSHEIRTPITTIVGFAELLEGTETNELQKRYLKAISSSAENLMLIVNDILDLSKIEAGKVKLVSKEFDLRKIVNEVIDSYATELRTKKLAIKTDIAADVPAMLSGDPVRLKQILLNLVNNAIKFTEQGGVELSAKVEEHQRSVALLRFAVTDTGIGIEQDSLTKLFKPFSQVDSSFTRKYGGAGLGLAICKTLATLMGGELWVDSKAGVGSTFHLRLPLAVSASAVEPEGSQTMRTRPAREGAPSHVLLVEDSETTRALFVEVLKLHGHRVDVARNGAEAVEKCRRYRYDLILMDLQMPVMDGIEALKNIRAMETEKSERVPVVALTAHAMEDHRIDILKKGFDGYVTKPTTAKILLNEMKRCLAK